MFHRLVIVAVLASLSVGGWTSVSLAQEASAQTPSSQIGNGEISQTLEGLRTLLQNTESRLEHLETRLATQDQRINQLQDTVGDLQQRVEGQMSILNESVQRQRSRLQQLQTLVILGGAVVLLLVIGGGIILRRGHRQPSRDERSSEQ